MPLCPPAPPPPLHARCAARSGRRQAMCACSLAVPPGPDASWQTAALHAAGPCVPPPTGMPAPAAAAAGR
eukprot:scaffold310455_cov19-Tisochrysis_lutea.AAC.1